MINFDLNITLWFEIGCDWFFQILRNTIFFQQYAGDHQGFLRELRGIWDILYPCGSWHDSFLTQAFQIQPTLNIPKASFLISWSKSCYMRSEVVPLNKTLWTIFQGKGEVFLQASNILQSSQRRPGVLVGLIMYKNR